MFSSMFFHPLAANIMHRADYLDRGLTPHLLDISKQGIRAKFMTPVFPVSFPRALWGDTTDHIRQTLTFP